MMPPHERGWREYIPDQPHAEIPYQCPVTFGSRGHHWQGPACENGKGCSRAHLARGPGLPRPVPGAAPAPALLPHSEGERVVSLLQPGKGRHSKTCSHLAYLCQV